MPSVRKTTQTIEGFNKNKIARSLMKEAYLNSETAEEVAYDVSIFIQKNNIQWLSGPLIREICCVMLAQRGLYEARKNYTRIGISIYDYKQLLYNGYKENSNQYKNPESIHAWVADQVASEYALLDLLPEHLARAHLDGWLHIHKLKYFDLRPFCAGWDARMILHCGMPPSGSEHSAMSAPAKHPMVAMLHLAKWMGIIQGSFQGGQGYDHFTAYSAPLLKGLSDSELDQMAQCFLFESNQIYAARGGQVPFTSIHCSPQVPDAIVNLPAVGLGGKIDGVYGDYQDECRRFFNAICRVEMKGDATGKLFNFPKHEVELRREWLEKHRDSYELVFQEAAKMGTPYFILYPPWMPSDASCQCCRIIFTKEGIKRFCKDPKKFDLAQSYMNIGSLQTVSINLPRLAYTSNGDDDRLYEALYEQLCNARDILLIKKQITERTSKEDPLLNKLISFPNGEKQPIFDMDRYSLTVGHIGLNEMLKAHLGVELHNPEALNFGLKFMKQLVKWLDEFSVEAQYNFTAWEQPGESTANRFAILDKRDYPNAIVNGKDEGVYYTNSNHIRYNAGVPLMDIINMQAQFHPVIKGGIITHIWLGERPDPMALFEFTKKIMSNTQTAYIAYTMDFTQCLDCGKFLQGRNKLCPNCHSANIEYWSRVTGYYSRVKLMPAGKVSEWQERDLHKI